jgi:hypothetical protein
VKYSRADENWSGTEHDLDRERVGNNVINRQTIFDLRTTVGISERFSATLSVPWVRGSWAVPLPLVPPGTRHEQDAEGFGDIVLTGRLWTLDPSENPHGNFQVGLGLKMPTGEEDARHVYPDIQGDDFRPRAVDVSIQPGDGGWGGVLDVGGFKDVGDWRLFLQGTYLANPREQNRTRSTATELVGASVLPDYLVFNSVPDQYFLQAGATIALGANFGAGASVRWEGVPQRDLFGGEDGFRRPGYAVSVAPALSWTSGAWTLAVSVPITTMRNRMENSHGDPGDATFADWAIIAGVSFRF